MCVCVYALNLWNEGVAVSWPHALCTVIEDNHVVLLYLDEGYWYGMKISIGTCYCGIVHMHYFSIGGGAYHWYDYWEEGNGIRYNKLFNDYMHS